jgi:Domain of Unknown Function (DUF1080)
MLKLISIFVILIACSQAKEKKLFNGRDLTNWKGNSDFWSVENGVIIARTTVEKPTKKNTFLIWQGGEIGDFELTAKIKISSTGNSGFQYRSKVTDEVNFVVNGYQADFEGGKTYSGILYEEGGREILAQRGQKTKIIQGSNSNSPIIEVIGETAKSAEIQDSIKSDEWNDYKIIAKGSHLQHFINGILTIDVIDETKEGAKKGVFALQLHAGAPMEIQFKDIVLTED